MNQRRTPGPVTHSRNMPSALKTSRSLRSCRKPTKALQAGGGGMSILRFVQAEATVCPNTRKQEQKEEKDKKGASL